MSEKIIITNNPMVKEKYKDIFSLEFYDVSFLDLLILVRDRIHIGYKLETHPLSGSVKPNETPYKTIVVSKGDSMDSDSLRIIENSILTTRKFLGIMNTPKWSEKILNDFQVVDLSLFDNIVDKIY